MDPATLDLIRRSTALFDVIGAPPQLSGADAGERARQLERNANLAIGGGQRQYAQDLQENGSAVRGAVDHDAVVRTAVSRVVDDQQSAHRQTQQVLNAALSDRAPAADTPMGAREAARRRAAYLRAQHQTVSRSRAQARRRAAALRDLKYKRVGRWRPGMPVPAELLRRLKGRGGAALRFALTQLGVPYVWGGTAWNKGLDCSGFVQGAYARVGVHLPRVTEQMIHIGVAVPRSQVAVGDLIFPSTGHVQMYAGGGKVIEAPYTGASVRIANMPNQILAIRRPV